MPLPLWAIPLITGGAAGVGSAILGGEQRRSDRDTFKRMRRQWEQAMGLLRTQISQIMEDPNLMALQAEGQAMLDPRVLGVGEAAGAAQIGRARTNIRATRERSAFARGARRSGAAQAGIDEADIAFNEQLLQLRALEAQQGRQMLADVFSRRQGAMAPLMAQLGQMTANLPVQRERAGNLFTDLLSGFAGGAGAGFATAGALRQLQE